MGSLYKRGSIWWVKYYRNGVYYRESSHSELITKARRLLNKRDGEIAEGRLPGIYFDKVRFDELAEDFLTDYRVNGKDTLVKAERSVRYLKKFFGGMRAIEVTTDKIKTYIEKRMKNGMSNASINRELAALKRIFHLAYQCTPPKVSLIPYIPMLKESNVRKGFFEWHEHKAIMDALPSYLKPIVTFAYDSGWRKEEILSRTIDKVDMNEGIIRLDLGEAKNEKGRKYHMTDEVRETIEAALADRNPACPYLFQRDGKQIKDFREAWESACIKAGLYKMVTNEEGNQMKVPTKLFHDYRRTALRNAVRSGTPEKVAMELSGHKTRSTFDRYNITSDQDLKESAIKRQAYHEKQSKVVIPFKRVQNE